MRDSYRALADAAGRPDRPAGAADAGAPDAADAGAPDAADAGAPDADGPAPGVPGSDWQDGASGSDDDERRRLLRELAFRALL